MFDAPASAALSTQQFHGRLNVRAQVLDKYGDIYGRERIAELLGVDLASLDVSQQQHEKKQEAPDNSVFAWYTPCFSSQYQIFFKSGKSTRFFIFFFFKDNLY